MTPDAERRLRLQYCLGRAAIFIAAPLVLLVMKLAGYRVRDLARVRREIGKHLDAHPGPWLICANHLTLIDSVILAWAMVPSWRYLVRYSLLPWNLPEKLNFYRSRAVTAACYLTKCIPVVRGGDRDEVKATLDKCAYLLAKGERLMIFPEGTRSRSGRVNTDDYPYGAGRLACTVPGCRVLCLYLRGDGQTGYSDFPRRGETFTLMVSECRTRSVAKGLRAHRECTRQVIRKLAEMEMDYLAYRSDRQ